MVESAPRGARNSLCDMHPYCPARAGILYQESREALLSR